MADNHEPTGEDQIDLGPWEVDPVDQLPKVIEPGAIRLTLWTSALGGDPVAHDIALEWDGEFTAEWYEDISFANDDLSPMSSSPVHGVMSWPNRCDVHLTFSWNDLGLRGYDRLPGAAPTHAEQDPDEAVKNPRNWVDLGDALLDFVLLDLGSRQTDPDEELSAEYHDIEHNVILELDDLFRRYIADNQGNTNFDNWLAQGIAAGKYTSYDEYDDE